MPTTSSSRPNARSSLRLLAGLGSPEMPARAEPRPPEEETPAAYVVKCACDPGEDGSGGETVVDHIRLFPVRETIRWTYRVHEQILPALRRANVPVRWTDLTVRHTGYSDRALRARKLVRDARILRGELDERPDDPFVLFNLGAIAIERQEWREALALLRRSLAGSAPTDSITRKLYALIARAHQMLGEPREALAACAEGLELDPEDAELIFRAAVVRRQTGDSEGARRCWERILTLRRPEQFASVDQGIYGHLTRRNLAALAAERGDRDEEARLWRAVLAECPGDREALAKLRRPSSCGVVPMMKTGRLLFASIHCYLDPSSGAALATRELLELLAARGWDCRAVTCGILDYQRETSLDDALEDPRARGLGPAAERLARARRGRGGGRPGARWRARHGDAHGLQPGRACTRTRSMASGSSTWPGRCSAGSGPT